MKVMGFHDGEGSALTLCPQPVTSHTKELLMKSLKTKCCNFHICFSIGASLFSLF